MNFLLLISSWSTLVCDAIDDATDDATDVDVAAAAAATTTTTTTDDDQLWVIQ